MRFFPLFLFVSTTAFANGSSVPGAYLAVKRLHAGAGHSPQAAVVMSQRTVSSPPPRTLPMDCTHGCELRVWDSQRDAVEGANVGTAESALTTLTR
jgi:hypothetical protein